MTRERRRVVVVGAGPVGSTLTMDLGWRDVPVLTLDERDGPNPLSPKCNTTSARSMEHFRRLGCASAVRRAGLPSGSAREIVYMTGWTGGHEIARIKPHSTDEHRKHAPDDPWPTPEPPHRINQLELEPILAAHARTFPSVEIDFGWRVENVVDEGDHAVVSAVSTRGGERREIEADWVIGCDGPRSRVRDEIGASLVGDRMQMNGTVFLRSRQLRKVAKHRPGWMHLILSRAGFMGLLAQNQDDLFTMTVPGVAPEYDAEAARTALRTIAGVEVDDLEVLRIDVWRASRVIADHWRKDRVFLAGDAAHLWVPLTGMAMNEGLNDATDLAWMIAAHHDGWAGNKLFDAYEAERKPACERTSMAAMSVLFTVGAWAGACMSPDIEDVEKGRALREQAAALILQHEPPQHNAVGLQLGFAYESSPIIAYEGTKPVASDIGTYTPQTTPGMRLPHFWLRDGGSVYDQLGRGYTLLRTDTKIAVDALVDAARRQNIPLTVLDVEVDSKIISSPLVMTRPDQVVAWKGDLAPARPEALISTLRGEVAA